MTEHTPRSTVVRAATAHATFPKFERSNVFLFDPDQPKEDPNDLLKRMGGRLTDPYAMNHNCPMCSVTMNWELFQVHMEACYRKWRKVKLNIERRTFAGATREAS